MYSPKIKKIIFDLNEVLVTHRDIDMSERYLAELGIEEREFWKTAIQFFTDYETGKINLYELFRRTFSELDINQKLIGTAERLHGEGLSLVDGIYDVLSSLSTRYELVLLAGDGEDSLDLKLDKFDLRRFFTRIYASCFEGTTKRDPEIYRKLLESEDVDPEETLFIDDIREHIDIASSLGINTIHFRDTENLREKLSQYGIDLS